MRFKLVLRGSLPSEGRGTIDAKHRLRREMHPQLRMLWDTHPTLGGSPGRKFVGVVVPRGRIELPTLRFSVVCSTN